MKSNGIRVLVAVIGVLLIAGWYGSVIRSSAAPSSTWKYHVETHTVPAATHLEAEVLEATWSMLGV